MLSLDLVQTVALAAVVLFAGYGIKRRVPLLTRYNIPAPVVGGLLVAAILSVAETRGVTLLEFDTTLQTPLQNAFFASVGFGASLALLRVGGPLVLIFFVLSTVAAVAQNLLGMGVATALGQPPLLGVLAGSVTLTGGPATGLAFAPMFEEAGVPSAATLAVAAAMVGIVSGGLIGGQVMDLESEGRTIDRAALERLHRAKTGALLAACVRGGALLGGARPDELEALTRYASAIGLAFQVVDDVLDVEGSADSLGKTAGKDAASNKPTYVTLLGLPEAKRHAQALRDEALAALVPFGGRARRLTELADWITQRKH